MQNYKVSGSDLTLIADAIRTKGGTNESLSFPDGFVSAVQSISSGESALIQKTIVANGTYVAEDDNADGYSSVTVAVSTPGYASGTFTGSTNGETLTVPISYSGNGYPVAVIVYPKGGANNSSSAFYSAVSKKAICIFAAVKCVSATAPDFTSADGSLASNKSTTITGYKNSDSDSSVYAVTYGDIVNSYGAREPDGSSARSLMFSSPSSMKVSIKGTNYGFLKDVEYTYHIVYSE